jgi:hypothetical protein
MHVAFADCGPMASSHPNCVAHCTQEAAWLHIMCRARMAASVLFGSFLLVGLALLKVGSFAAKSRASVTGTAAGS